MIEIRLTQNLCLTEWRIKMDVKKITKLYVEEIKRYTKNKDTVLLTDLQKEELFNLDADVDINDIAEMYALQLIDCIDVLKSKGLL